MVTADDPTTVSADPAAPSTVEPPASADDAEFAVREARESTSRRSAETPPGDEPVTAAVPVVTGAQLDEPRRRRPRPVRRIDLWSVLKLAIVLYTCLYGAVLAAVALLWGVAYSSGQVAKLESFLADVGLENYRFYGDQMFRAVMAIGAVGVLAATLVTVLTAALVNVVSEITGGIRVVVIEEDLPVRR